MPETLLLQADRQARADALDVGRSFIVQAPAGSGKTELLIQRYLRLLAVVDEPEEILAITFTRKAAAEMRLRVLDALQKAQEKPLPAESHLRLTFDAAKAVLKRDADRGWRLVTHPRRMRIQTIDALNGSLARMQPLTVSSAASTSSVAEDSAMLALYSEAAAATLDWLGDSGPDAAAVEDVLLHVDGNTRRYIDYLSRMLRTRDQWLPFVASGLATTAEADLLRSEFENNLIFVVRERLRGLGSLLPSDAAAEFLALGAYAAENLLAAGNADVPICYFATSPGVPDEASLQTPSGLQDAVRSWLAVADLLLTKSGDVRKQVNKNQGFPPGDKGQKKAMTALLQSLSEYDEFIASLREVRLLPPLCYTDEQWSVLLALFRVLGVAVGEFMRLSRARGLTDHIEIAMSAGKVLGSAEDPGDIALLLDYQIRHILVDEMQDTSKAQYRMLEALTGGWQPGDGRTLFCVGDPMQSIYRFRNAEVAQFLLARERGLASLRLEPLILRRNFRSGEVLVDWFNAVFGNILPPTDDPLSSAVKYSRSIAVEPRAGLGAIHVHPLFGASGLAEAKLGCSVIRSALDSAPDDTVAVLVRGRTQLPALLAELRTAGIAYHAVDIDRLGDLPEIIDVLALTRALVHPGDRIAWLALLRSPWVGLDWSDLLQLVDGERNACVLELLQDDARRKRLSNVGSKAVGEFLSKAEPFTAVDRSWPLHRRVERAWFALGGPALADDANATENVYHYLRILARLESGGTIADIAALAGQLDMERVSTSSTARVQIMTMHKAKGLQFDHVILYALGRYTSGNKKSVLSWFDLPDEHGAGRKIISPVGREDELENDPLHQFIERTERAKDKHELARLLYVASTRARKSLHLVGHTGVTADGSDYRPPHSSSLLKLLWPAVEKHFDRAFEPSSAADEVDHDSEFVQPRLRRFDSAWRLPQVGELAIGESSVASVGDTSQVDYDWVGLDARLAGTIVHRWLQLAAEGRIRLSPATIRQSRTRSSRWLRELGASEGMVTPICDRVAQALKAAIGDKNGRWLLDGNGHAELALSGHVDGRIESVSIDRVRIDEDGTHWLVDYKTSSHEGGNLAGFLQAESERYRGQLVKYARIYRAWSGQVPRCALYFPLLQRFVEVNV